MNSRANWSKFTNLDRTGAIAAVNHRIPPLVSLLLVVLIGWQFAQLVWTLVPGTAAGDPVATPLAAALSSSKTSTAADVSAIAAAHIFGLADAASETPEVLVEPDDDLADTRLVNLVLKGTVASANPDYSVALISDSNKEQEVYVVGDSISSRVSLHAIYADRVVLDEDGAFTNLKLPREYASNPRNTVRQRTTATRQSPSNTNSIQNIVSQNLTKLTDVIRPTPYMQNGQPAGYRVYPGRDRKQFAALGLRPGDIIKDIDGQSLTDPTQAMRIFQSLGTAEQVTVTIERAGQAETLVLKTSQLDLSGEQNK